jgi:hypothetical protein
MLAYEDAIGSHACSLLPKGILLGWSLLLPVGTVNFVQTLKDEAAELLESADDSGLLLRKQRELDALKVRSAVCVYTSANIPKP